MPHCMFNSLRGVQLTLFTKNKDNNEKYVTIVTNKLFLFTFFLQQKQSGKKED